jgi:hypothetical protein
MRRTLRLSSVEHVWSHVNQKYWGTNRALQSSFCFLFKLVLKAAALVIRLAHIGHPVSYGEGRREMRTGTAGIISFVLPTKHSQSSDTTRRFRLQGGEDGDSTYRWNQTTRQHTPEDSHIVAAMRASCQLTLETAYVASGGNTSRLSSGGVLFETRLKHRLHWLRFCGLSQYLRANAEQYLGIGHDRFLQYSLQFSSY